MKFKDKYPNMKFRSVESNTDTLLKHEELRSCKVCGSKTHFTDY